MINCYSIETAENEHLYGPGKRLLIYLQGCSLHCKGCFNAHMWKFGAGTDYSAEDILEMCIKENVEGITILGGEPLDQAEGLSDIVEDVKDAGFTIILFTGYTENELDNTKRTVWDMADMVICGRYEQEKRNLYLQFRGSTNQEVIKHKGKYQDYKIQDGETEALITIGENGDMNFKGFYEDELKEIFEGIIH